ncbi:MAG: M1 family metallopeptidase [Chitinophagales bacterium]|nr:M1 family metallopeptidase [Chitinophagales bacterium]
MKTYLLLFLQITFLNLYSQENYWQQNVDYTIDVSLNDKEHSLTGFETITYTNNSPDTLKFIWFHLWPNAYKNDKTAFSDQLLENGSTRFYFSSKEEKGYINRLDFKVNNITASTEDHPEHIDIIKLILPSPLPPGQKAVITTPFHVKLPFNFSRGGHDGQSYQVTQWFPKPAVYDKNGWHPMPYLDQGEFYSEFGDFTVNITVPENYAVAATGELQNTDEKNWIASRANFRWEPETQKQKNTYGQVKKVTKQFPESAEATKTLQYIQKNVHDFAWFADKRFTVQQDTLQLPSGRIIDIFSFYTHYQYTSWENAVQSAKNAVLLYSELVGEYPYNTVSVVEGPEGYNGGMEYPTITLIAPSADVKMLDKIIVHEVGHNWFYGILGSNERKYPWMDEGINSYYDALYDSIKNNKTLALEKLLIKTKAITKTDQPISSTSEEFSPINYGLIAYSKTAWWLQYLRSQIGTEAFNTGVQQYYQQWKFKHPQPKDFKSSIEKTAGTQLDSLFSLLNKKGTIPDRKPTGTKFAFIADIRKFREYAKNPSQNLITFGPAIGRNYYDKFMVGAFITNLKLPPSAFNFFAAPLYATGSKKLTGLAMGMYSLYPDNIFQRVDIGVNASSFSADLYTDADGKKVFTGFRKISPSVRFTFRSDDHRSHIRRYISFRSYFIGEDGLHFFRDTVITGVDTSISTKYNVIKSNRTLNQLKFVIENNRVLYPYRGEFKIDQGADFIRPAFTGKYFFNYPKQGGLTVRLFAGKFFYTGAKTSNKQFQTDRYHLNLTGANGYEDYTYSDYFVGRNEFDGLASQQIMERDGAFKVRTDLLADKVGKTDDWLVAVNFSTSIPGSINPLSLLPVKIPLNIFLDIGTYAESWKQGSEEDRFLFDAGLHIPLFRQLINIYIPLVYSPVFKDYIQSTSSKKERLWKKISFSINISDFNFRRVGPGLLF